MDVYIAIIVKRANHFSKMILFLLNGFETKTRKVPSSISCLYICTDLYAANAAETIDVDEPIVVIDATIYNLYVCIIDADFKSNKTRGKTAPTIDTINKITINGNHVDADLINLIKVDLYIGISFGTFFLFQ